jgi:hypothetical protein
MTKAQAYVILYKEPFEIKHPDPTPYERKFDYNKFTSIFDQSDLKPENKSIEMKIEELTESKLPY